MSNSNGGPPPGGYGAPPGGGGGPFGGRYGPPGGAGYGPPPGSMPGGASYGPPPAQGLPGTPLPPAGYGGPSGAGYTPPPPFANAPNAFGQPVPYKMPPPSTFAIPTRGSFGLGFAIGLFGACVGVGLVFALAKGPDTKKGAAVGFGVFLALCALSQLIGALAP